MFDIRFFWSRFVDEQNGSLRRGRTIERRPFFWIICTHWWRSLDLLRPRRWVDVGESREGSVLHDSRAKSRLHDRAAITS